MKSKTRDLDSATSAGTAKSETRILWTSAEMVKVRNSGFGFCNERRDGNVKSSGYTWQVWGQ